MDAVEGWADAGVAEAEVDSGPTQGQIREAEIMDLYSNSASDNPAALEEKVKRQTTAVQIAQDAYLALSNATTGFVKRNKPGQGQITEAMSPLLPQGADRLQELSSEAHSQDLPQSFVATTLREAGSEISSLSNNLHLASQELNPQRPAYPQLPPRVKHMPPPCSSPENSPAVTIPPRPPAVVIVDGGVTSITLSPADIMSFWDVFARNTRVLLESKGRVKIYHMKTIMKMNLPEVFAWYTMEAGAAIESVLMLELLDNNGQPAKTFRISRGDLSYFQLVKQTIWDTFWKLFSSGESDSLSLYVSVPDDDHSYGATHVGPITAGTGRHVATITQIPTLSVQTDQFNYTARHLPTRKSNIRELLN